MELPTATAEEQRLALIQVRGRLEIHRMLLAEVIAILSENANARKFLLSAVDLITTQLVKADQADRSALSEINDVARNALAADLSGMREVIVGIGRLREGKT